MKTILVKNGIVVNIVKNTPSTDVLAPSLYDYAENVADNANINIGATWDGTNYTNPPPPENNGIEE